MRTIISKYIMDEFYKFIKDATFYEIETFTLLLIIAFK